MADCPDCQPGKATCPTCVEEHLKRIHNAVADSYEDIPVTDDELTDEDRRQAEVLRRKLLAVVADHKNRRADDD